MTRNIRTMTLFLALASLVVISPSVDAGKRGSTKQTPAASSEKVKKATKSATAKRTEVSAPKSGARATREPIKNKATKIAEHSIQYPVQAQSAPPAAYNVIWRVFASAGGVATSPTYAATGQAGLTTVGESSSPSYDADHGELVPPPPSGGCCITAGDANNTGTVTIGDVTFLIGYIFSGGPAPVCCEEGDADGFGTITIGDVTYLISYIFGGGPAPQCGPSGMSCMIE